jgi:hypothetical protein
MKYVPGLTNYEPQNLSAYHLARKFFSACFSPEVKEWFSIALALTSLM